MSLHKNSFAEDFLKKAKAKQSEHKKFLEKVKSKSKRIKNLDEQVLSIHTEVFQEINCLSCANCCLTTGPLFTKKDIERISNYLKISEHQFEQNYLQVDEDQDYVLQKLPCVFLTSENYCTIYEVRPKACKEFPHTDRKKIHQINSLTLKNTLICPAAFLVVEKMKERMKL